MQKVVTSHLDLTVEQFLAQYRNDRSRLAATLRERQWRITSAPVSLKDFWEFFDSVVAPDGTVDLSTIAPTQAPARSEGTIPAASFGAAMLEAATKLVALCMTAFAAGYAVGQELGEAQDEDEDTEPAEGDGDEGAEGHGGEGNNGDGPAGRSRVVLNAGAGFVSLVVDGHVARSDASVDSSRSASAVQDVLAQLKRDRDRTLRAWQSGVSGRIVSASFARSEIEATIDAAVRPDGSIDLAALQAPTPPGILGPAGWAIATAAGAVLVSFAAGLAVGYMVETSGEGEEEDGDGGDTGTGGEESRRVRATLRPGDRNDIELRVKGARRALPTSGAVNERAGRVNK